jgi:hypothetical protein
MIVHLLNTAEQIGRLQRGRHGLSAELSSLASSPQSSFPDFPETLILVKSVFILFLIEVGQHPFCTQRFCSKVYAEDVVRDPGLVYCPLSSP